MIRVQIVCEGPTEELFVRYILAPHFALHNIFVFPVIIGSAGQKGGNVTVDRLFRNVRTCLLEDRQCYCTTLIDYYGLPPDFPGKREAAQIQSLEDKQATVCRALTESLRQPIGENAMRRFIPYVQMHEFEALLFCDTAALAQVIRTKDAKSGLDKISSEFATPEYIDDSPDTAPSKRIEAMDPGYRKPTLGLQVALEIGLPAMRDQCRLFRNWLRSLESLAA